MKLTKTRLVFTLILVSIQFSLSGAWFESNILGQKMSEIEESEKVEFAYTLHEVVDNSTTTTSLYLLEEIISKRVEKLDGEKKSITLTDYDDNELHSLTISTYEKGLPLSIQETVDGNVFNTNFRYENGQLVEKKSILNGIMSSLITYWRNSDGSLALSREIRLDKENLISFYSHDKDSIVITQQSEKDIVKSTLHPSYVVTNEYSVEGKILQTQQADVDDEGKLTIKEKVDNDEIETVYSIDGVLLEKHSVKSTGEIQDFLYEYDGSGNLIHSTQIITAQKVERIERYYTNGVLKSKTQYIEETPVKSTRYNLDGTSIVTLFEENRPYADVTYALDGKRVLSIEYRKEE